MRIGRIVDLVAAISPRLPAGEQITRANAPTTLPNFVDNAEIASPETIHAANGAIDKGVRRDRRQRLAHDLPDRRVECGSAERRDRAQHVAFRMRDWRLPP